MQARPLVSVVIPNHNRLFELERSLKSVLGQTYGNLEIIIVDDNSVNIESIVGMLNSIDDSRIVLVRHTENKGGGAARNSGIVASRGEYIAFLDSDDEWKSTKIEKQLEILSNSSTEDAVVFCKSEFISDKRTYVMPRRGIEDSERVCDYLFVNDGCMATPTLLVSSKLAKKLLFNPDLRRHQDFDFLLRIGGSGARFYFIPNVLVIVHRENDRGHISREWNPALTEKFANDYRGYFSTKAYNNFLFINLINTTAICKSKLHSIRMLRLVNIFEVRYINILKYIRNLLRPR